MLPAFISANPSFLQIQVPFYWETVTDPWPLVLWQAGPDGFAFFLQKCCFCVRVFLVTPSLIIKELGSHQHIPQVSVVRRLLRPGYDWPDVPHALQPLLYISSTGIILICIIILYNDFSLLSGCCWSVWQRCPCRPLIFLPTFIFSWKAVHCLQTS